MCGGTHVKNTSEIIGLTVTKIKKVPTTIMCTTIRASSYYNNDIDEILLQANSRNCLPSFAISVTINFRCV